LFRVRNKKETIYCYSDEERQRALIKLGKTAEITRFKGLGEISPDEFKHFIGPDIRLEPVMITKDAQVQHLFGFYMGKNTPERQEFIIEQPEGGEGPGGRGGVRRTCQCGKEHR
jgi:topoisomerase-4 subunit B